MKFPTLAAFLADIAGKNYHLTAIDDRTITYGNKVGGHGRLIDLTYSRLAEDGTVRCLCFARLVLRRWSYAAEEIIDVEELTARFHPIYGSAIVSSETTFSAFTGESLGMVA